MRVAWEKDLNLGEGRHIRECSDKDNRYCIEYRIVEGDLRELVLSKSEGGYAAEEDEIARIQLCIKATRRAITAVANSLRRWEVR